MSRILRGLIAACGTAILVTVLAACVHVVFLGGTDPADFARSLVAGDKEETDALLYIAGIAAIAATAVFGVAFLFIAWPLLAVLNRFGFISLSSYMLTGSFVGLVTMAVLLVTRLIPPILLWSMAVLISGPLAAIVFWVVAAPSRAE